MARWFANLAVAVAIVAASFSATPSLAAGPTRLVVGVAGEIDQPLVEHEVRALQYPTLTAFALDTLETVPGVASEWTPAPNGFTYTIAPGATWSDGTPVTSADVEFSLIEQYDDYTGLEAVVEDERRVTVNGITDPSLLLPILPAHAYATDSTVSGGSWQVAERGDDHVTMTVVQKDGRPALDEITFRSFDTVDAMFAALDAGDIDVAGNVPATAYATLREIDGVTAIHASDGDQWILQLRVDDVDLRRTIARAIDRDRLVAQFANDVGRTSPIPVVARGAQWRLDSDVAGEIAPRLAYDPGTPTVEASLTIGYTDDETAAEIAAFVTEALSAVGIEVETAAPDDADIVLVRRDPTDDPAAALIEYTCEGGVWCDEEYDAAYATLVGTRDTATRIAAVQEMVELLATEVPEVVLYAPDTLQGFRTDNVTGLLREPADERLVVFWPSTQQYAQVVPTATLGGEDIPDSALVAIAVGVGVSVLAIYAVVKALGKRKPRTDSPQ